MAGSGIADDLLVDALPVERYEWFGADQEPIVAFDMPPAPSGWAFSYTFFQPELEGALEKPWVGCRPSRSAAESPAPDSSSATIVSPSGYTRSTPR